MDAVGMTHVREHCAHQGLSVSAGPGPHTAEVIYAGECRLKRGVTKQESRERPVLSPELGQLGLTAGFTVFSDSPRLS